MKRFFETMPRLRVAMMLAVLFTVALAAQTVYCYADKADLKNIGEGRIASGPLVSVTLGKGEIVSIKGDVADVLVANPAIADVVAIQSNKLYVVGSTLGDTNLMVLDASGNLIQRFDIHVEMDEMAIQEYLNEVFPNEQVKVKALNDQVILTGTVSSPAISSRIAQVVGSYVGQVQGSTGPTDQMIANLLDVAGERQVMLKVRVLEASKNLLKELGINTELNASGLASNNLDATVDTESGTGLSQTAFALGTLVFDDGNFGPLTAMLSALQQGDMARTLAEPNLTAISGQEAGFLAGGEFPVPTGRDSEGNVLVEFRSFGVSLNFRPTVLSENRINLQLNTEVSSLARDESVTIAGLDVPGLNIRRASTTIEVPSGGGLMIGGLLQSKTVQGMSGLPGIMNVPVLGDLVSSRSFNREETELVVLVTAYLVSPFGDKDDKSKPPIPEERSSPLSAAFADNIRRIYGRKAPADMLGNDMRIGYLIN